MIADVIIIQNPSKEEKEAGQCETILAPQKQYVGKSEDAIKMAAIIDNATLLESAVKDRVELLIRPF